MRKVLFLLAFIPVIVFNTALAQTCGSTNIAVGKSVVVSSESQYHQASNAVDGNLGWGWYTQNTLDTNYIYVDLAQSYTICKVKLTWESSNGRGKNYKIQTSADAVNWTTIANRTNNGAMVDSFTVSGSGRYVRLYMTARLYSWANYELAEIEIYNNLSNYRPITALTSPVNNYTTVAGTNLKLTATASDADGSISKVEFYQDAIKVGEATSAPFEYTLTNLQPGTFLFRAKAFDNTNADSLSAPITVKVNPSNRWSLTGNSGTNPDSNFVGTTDNKKLVFRVNNAKKMTIQPNGLVGIGTDTVMSDPEARLAVNGTVYAKKLIIQQAGWADYVFEEAYRLMALPELEAYIRQHKHLPELPTTAIVQKNGADVARVQELLLKKIEELTLYIIEQHKKLENQAKQLEGQQKKIEALERNASHR